MYLKIVFFSKTEFYSSFKNEVTSDEEYKNMKKFWPFLLLKKISKLSDIYNFQDAIIICEFFENRAKEMTKNFSYNSQKCTSTSSLSGCIHQCLPRAIILFQKHKRLSVDLTA